MDSGLLRARQLDRERARSTGPGAGSRLLLLKADGTAQRFKTLAEVADSWGPRYSEQSGDAFEVVKSDEEFNAAAREASHIVITDSTNAALNNQLFTINRETTTPAGTFPHWVIGVSPAGKRYAQP